MPTLTSTNALPPFAGDALLLCTDGVHDTLDSASLQQLIVPGTSALAQAQILRKAVLRASARAVRDGAGHQQRRRQELVATALCAWYRAQGYKVAPFKAQNMSNNARVVARRAVPGARSARRSTCRPWPQAARPMCA
jgi:hypothetical protein